MSVVGFDDVLVAPLVVPPLTTVRQPLADMGSFAVSMLIRQIEGVPLDAMRVELATSLVVRDSCSGPSGPSGPLPRPARARPAAPPEVTTTDVVVDIDTGGKAVVPHWRVCVGGGRTAEALRAQFQRHLEMVQGDMPFSYLRMHGIFHEDMMVYRESPGGPVLNWQYVDMVYDHWLSVGIRPFVELGFMPYDLASGDATVFWWRGNITPPKDWARWSWLVGRFVEHLAERYGIEEVRRWYFEVWNEPNLGIFWEHADFGAYMELYERTARAIKNIDGALRVGGPASSGAGHEAGQAPWGGAFLAECRRRDLPIDFFSTHPYPTIHTVDLAGRGEMSWDGPDRLGDGPSGHGGPAGQCRLRRPRAALHRVELEPEPSGPRPRHSLHGAVHRPEQLEGAGPDWFAGVLGTERHL